MICYRIYTENTPVINDKVVVWMKELNLDKATIMPSAGVWEGKIELGMVIEIILPSLDGRIVSLAEMIRTRGSQEAVLVTRHEVVGFMLTKDGLEVL